MNNPTWTPWLKNPGTGQSPVPGWAHECEVQFRSRNQGIAYYPEQWCWLDFGGGTSITHYRYAIPESLLDLAQTVPKEEPRHYEGGTVCYSKLTPGTWESCHPNSSLAKEPGAWTNHDRDRARRDLGYTTPAERLADFGRKCAGETAPEVKESSGGDNDYWLLYIAHPKRLEPYTVECEDLIEAMQMTFQEGEAFKAIWRKCMLRLGFGKPGDTELRNAQKSQHFSNRMVVMAERNKAETTQEEDDK